MQTGDEVARDTRRDGPVQVRGNGQLFVMFDPADPGGAELHFTADEWTAFVGGVHRGEFDLDESGCLP
jgi:hypothetical protein